MQNKQKKNFFLNLHLKFINLLMINGKKNKAFNLFYKSLKYVFIKKNTINLKKKNTQIYENKNNIYNKTKIKNLNMYVNSLQNKEVHLFQGNKENEMISPRSAWSNHYKLNYFSLLFKFSLTNKNNLIFNIYNFLNINYLVFSFIFKYITKNNYIFLNLKKKNNVSLTSSVKNSIVFLKYHNKLNKENNLKLNLSNNLLNLAINNVKPSVQVKKVKINGKNYNVPQYLSEKKQKYLAIRMIILSAKKRKKNTNIPFFECLGLELIEAINKQGKVYQKRNEMHKISQENQAYIIFKWW